MAFVCLAVLNFTEGANNFGLGQALASTSSDSSSNSSSKSTNCIPDDSNTSGMDSYVFLTKKKKREEWCEHTCSNEITNSAQDTSSQTDQQSNGTQTQGGAEGNFSLGNVAGFKGNGSSNENQSNTSGSTAASTSGTNSVSKDSFKINLVHRSCIDNSEANDECTPFVGTCKNPEPGLFLEDGHYVYRNQ